VYLDSENRPTITPQLALRVAVIGGVALALFGIVFFRLWYLQVLSGDRYLAEARNNQLRRINVQAPRGKIVDREGRVLVDNRTSLAVQVSPERFPRDPVQAKLVYRRLGRVLRLNWTEVRKRVQDGFQRLPFSAVTVKQDVKLPVVTYIEERKERFPSVNVEPVSLRFYPHRQIGAQLFGTVGEVTKEQLDDHRDRYRGVAPGDRVGQDGIEYSYDRFLRGKDGANRVQVDALGHLQRQLSVQKPIAGRQLRLGIDLHVQEIGQHALAGSKAAFVVMDVRSGEIRALGSLPAFDPNIFAKSIKESDYKRVTSEAEGKPLYNRAIHGDYPTGSTFKLITSVAALEGGLITTDTPLFDGGSVRIGNIDFQNAGGVSHGSIALREAIKVSSDVFFYQLGAQANGAGDGHLIQRWAGRLGLGRRTGIDLPGETAGLVPSPEWRNHLLKKHQTDRPWTIGDNVNLAVGQGDLGADPLQMAVAYAAVANGGYVVRPHVGERIEDADGRVLQEFQAPARRKLHIRPEFRQAILDGLREAASEGGGTSADVFKGFPIPVAGKTGTAEKGAGRADQSWYLALAPYPSPRYVVAVTDEAGGFGAERAAPVARQILAALFRIRKEENKVVRGASRTR
jgi:penicillin-binding protein 2